MKLIAQKPCSFRGEKFYIGDEIPSEYVLLPKTQEQRGVLTIVNDDAGTAPAPDPVTTMEVVIRAEEGDMPLNLTQEGLQAVVDVLTGTADDAKPIIKEMTDGDALILLHLTDSRKSVKAAAEERAQEINSEESEGEQ
ncbi:MAG: hypothetical protein ACI4PO_09075 [Faecousia sp.]